MRISHNLGRLILPLSPPFDFFYDSTAIGALVLVLHKIIASFFFQEIKLKANRIQLKLLFTTRAQTANVLKKNKKSISNLEKAPHSRSSFETAHKARQLLLATAELRFGASEG